MIDLYFRVMGMMLKSILGALLVLVVVFLAIAFGVGYLVGTAS